MYVMMRDMTHVCHDKRHDSCMSWWETWLMYIAILMTSVLDYFDMVGKDMDFTRNEYTTFDNVPVNLYNDMCQTLDIMKKMITNKQFFGVCANTKSFYWKQRYSTQK